MTHQPTIRESGKPHQHLLAEQANSLCSKASVKKKSMAQEEQKSIAWGNEASPGNTTDKPPMDRERMLNDLVNTVSLMVALPITSLRLVTTDMMINQYS